MIRNIMFNDKKFATNNFQQQEMDTWNVMTPASSDTQPWLLRTLLSLQQPTPPISTQQSVQMTEWCFTINKEKTVSCN